MAAFKQQLRPPGARVSLLGAVKRDFRPAPPLQSSADVLPYRPVTGDAHPCVVGVDAETAFTRWAPATPENAERQQSPEVAATPQLATWALGPNAPKEDLRGPPIRVLHRIAPGMFHPTIPLPTEQAQSLRRLLLSSELHSIENGYLLRDDQQFWVVLHALPQPIRAYLLKHVPDPRALALTYLRELCRAIGPGTFLSTLVERFDRSAQEGASFRAFLSQGLHTLEGLGDLEVHRRTAEEKVQALKASAAWRRDYFVPLPHGQETDNSVWVQIGSTRYRGVLRNQRAILTVQHTVRGVEQVVTPEWNPINPHYQQQHFDGELPAYYPAEVGPDGLFYLTNGNHRSRIHKARSDTLPIAIEWPPKTMGLSAYLDAIGVRQPKSEQLVALRDGAIHPFDLIPEAHRMRLVLTEADLVIGEE